MTVPTSLAILNRTYSEPSKKSRALGIYSGIAGLGATTGTILGGLLATHSTWRWGEFEK
jgi:MFS transporter, DHA2 family, methylenomycin A resistance protein